MYAFKTYITFYFYKQVFSFLSLKAENFFKMTNSEPVSLTILSSIISLEQNKIEASNTTQILLYCVAV